MSTTTMTTPQPGAKAPKRLRDVAVTTQEGFTLDPKIVVIEKNFNARDFSLPENVTHVRELADSIKEVGVQNPIIVRWQDGTVFLVDGECRLRASLLAIEEGADLKAIPAIAENRGTSEADRVLSLVIRNGAKPLNAVEQASVFARLIAKGWTAEDIAKRVGCSLAKISGHLSLAEAPDALKTLVATGTVAPTLAISEIREKGPTKALAGIQKAAEGLEEGKTRVTKKAVDKTSNDTPVLTPTKKVLDLCAVLEKIEEMTDDQKIKKLVRKTLETYAPKQK